jgi:polar amino acid transport system substrate-binding protein
MRRVLLSLLAPTLALVAFPAHADPVSLIAFAIPPLIDDRDGKAVGPGAELAGELAMAAGINPVVTVLPVGRAYLEAERGGRILVMTTRTPERESKFTWVVESFEDELCFATVSPHSRIDTLEEARSLTSIGVRTYAFAEAFLRENGFDRNLAPTALANSSAQQLVRGRIDAWLTSRAMIIDIWRTEKLDETKLQIGAPVAPMPYWIAASKDVAPDIILKMQNRFQEMKTEETYDKLFAAFK